MGSTHLSLVTWKQNILASKQAILMALTFFFTLFHGVWKCSSVDYSVNVSQTRRSHIEHKNSEISPLSSMARRHASIPCRSLKWRHNEHDGVSNHQHYSDIIMSTMASQFTSLTIVNSTVYSGADQRKHQSFASLAFGGEFTGDHEAYVPYFCWSAALLNCRERATMISAVNSKTELLSFSENFIYTPKLSKRELSV